MSTVREMNVEVRVNNIGGISETDVTIPPGVTVLTGRNATNRTSFLLAIMAALGSDNASLKADADEGSVTLDPADDGGSYTRTLSRRGRDVVTEGEPYLEDATLADLFAFLLESNDARRAVARNDDLRELIMRPVDTEEIKDRIDELEAERRRIDDQLDELSRLETERSSLESERKRLESKLEAKRTALEETLADLEATDVDVEEPREETVELDAKFDELQHARSELEEVRFQLETERESIASLEEDLADVEDGLDGLDTDHGVDLADIEREVEQLRDEKQALEADVNELQSLIRFNEEMLETSETPLPNALDDEGGEGAITDQLLAESGPIVCWTCGSEVDTEQIESTVDRLRESSTQKFEELRSIEADLDDRKRTKQRLEEDRRRRRELERRLERSESEIEDREARIEDLEAERDEFETRIESLEATVDELKSEDYSEVVDLHKEANRLEIEVGRLEQDLEEVVTELEEVDRRLSERSDLEDGREEIGSELADLRTRVERIEKEAIEEFTTTMDDVLDRLDYANLDRIWLERVEREVREGRRTVEKTAFELHVVRSTDEGASYEDTVEHLSESEREVTGLVFALAGYLVHDVHETVPFMLLDSLEAIDSRRIAALVEYLEEYVDYLIVALLPEDAAALDDDYARVTSI